MFRSFLSQLRDLDFRMNILCSEIIRTALTFYRDNAGELLVEIPVTFSL